MSTYNTLTRDQLVAINDKLVDARDTLRAQNAQLREALAGVRCWDCGHHVGEENWGGCPACSRFCALIASIKEQQKP